MKKPCRLYECLAVFCLAFVGFVGPAQAFYTLTDGNSSASVNPSSQAGMFNWTVDGVTQLAQQWFWYRIGTSSPESSVNTISADQTTQPDSTHLTTRYINSQISVRIDYTLAGGALGDGTSTIVES